MPNTFVSAQKYLPLEDEVYKASAKSSILDESVVEFVGADTVKVYKMTMDGLGNYSRANGYAEGDVTGQWETLKLERDRGRSFSIDRMDNEESLGLAMGKLVGNFIRQKVAPEIDAYTFAKIAGTSGILSATPDDITIGTTNVAQAIEEGARGMNEEEVPVEGRIIFMSETAYAGLQSNVTRHIANTDIRINNGIVSYGDMTIIRVPQHRFYSAITLLDGKTSGQEAGGYVGTSTTGYNINFMIVHPSAVCKVAKHVLPRIFTPDQNQTADAYKFDYRIVHDCFVYDNKVKGIYLHRGSTALS